MMHRIPGAERPAVSGAFVLVVAALAFVVPVVAGCGSRGAPAEEQAATRTPVRVVEIEPVAITATVSATGTIRARHDVPISAEAGGRVVEVVARVGDRVSEGDVLVRLDSELARLTYRQAEAQVLLAEAELDDAEVGLERAMSLWESGDIADAEKEAAERRAKSARASFAAATAGASAAARQLSNTDITSPVDGTVAYVHAEEGHLIALGAPAAHVVNDDVVEIELGLTEDQVSDVHARRPADVRVRALPGESFKGMVEYVGRRADDMTKTYPARVVVPNSSHRLRSGMVAEVTIAAREYEGVIVIDRDWVVERFGEPAVYVAADTLAELRRLTLGKVVGNRVIVTSGLEPGDAMVTFGHDQLNDGALLEIKDAPADSGGSTDRSSEGDAQSGASDATGSDNR
jgi:RND family efflux transporter MFP subunit